MSDSQSKTGFDWKIENQSQTNHCGDYCDLTNSVRHENGTLQVIQRIHDSAAGYREGKKRVFLIAAAPEMYAALEALIAETERCDNPGLMGVGREDDVMLKAKAALKSAQGEK